MDTSVSGGMAPALQSTNHQSSDLVKTQATANGVKEVFPHEKAKVNGNALEDDDKFHKLNGKTALLSTTLLEKPKLVLDSYASGDGSSSKSLASEQSMTVKESFSLTNHKELKATVTLPSAHIGQGDCAVPQTVNHNGWSNHKKVLVSGVLQENNSVPCNIMHNGKESPVKEKSSKVPKANISEENMTCKSTSCREVNENRPNGQIDSTSACLPSASSALKTTSNSATCSRFDTSTTVTFSSASDLQVSATASSCFRHSEKTTESPTFFTNNSAYCPTEHQHQSSKVVNAEHLKTVAGSSDQDVHFHSARATSSSSGSSRTTPVELPISTTSQLPQAWKYTDLLNSDLSKLKEGPHISHKLANTLQELAASLKGTSLQPAPEISHKLSCNEFNHTVTPGDHEKHTSVKSLDFTSNVLSSSKQTEAVSEEDRVNFQSKVKTATENMLTLQKRLALLQNKINLMRFRGMGSYVQRELRTVVRQSTRAWASKTEMDGSQGEGNWWEPNFVNITDLHTGHAKDNKNTYYDFWERVFMKDSQRDQDSFRWRGRTNSNVSLPDSSRKSETRVKSPSGQVKKEFQIDEEKMTSMVGINFDPIVQLTRVEHASTVKRDSSELLERARTNNGILQKEFDYVRSSYDPDLTDCSSDEDAVQTVRQQRPSKFHTTEEQKGKKETTNKRHRKSFCKWVAERAEISRRWTWLQSQISNLEFNIRQQGEMYRQLRNEKGPVQLDIPSSFLDTPKAGLSRNETIPDQNTPKALALYPHQRPAQFDTPSSTSPSACNVNQLLNNMRYQTTRLFDNLSPLSGGSPSPKQSMVPGSPKSSISIPHVQQMLRTSNRIEERSMTSARTRPLSRSNFRHRKLVRLPPACKFPEKLKPKTVPNDSSVMRGEEVQTKNHQNAFSSLALKAAIHDHSYHTVISSIKDLPLSVTMQAVMKSNRKWCKKPGSSSLASERSRSTESKERSKRHRHKKSKRKLHKRKERAHSMMLPPNFSIDDVTDSKRRRYSSQMSHASSESGRKRHRGMSFDSDMESSVVVGSFSSYQQARGTNSGTSTPTHETANTQNYWKKKKSSEQAYDINNIVIPHGLTSARIEKLAYKEIQTPSWREVEPKEEGQHRISSDQDQLDCGLTMEAEEISEMAYKIRHDRYEIMEKKKYMAYMEWSITRKGRGSRMSNAGGPITPESVSPSSPSYTPSPVNNNGDQPSTSGLNHPGCTPYTPQTSTLSQPLPSPSSPTAKDGVQTRRMSVDHNQGRATTPLSHLQQPSNNNTNTSLRHSHSSPNWHNGFVYRRGSHENAAPINNRTLSDIVNSPSAFHQDSISWEIRKFPLEGDDLHMMENVEYAQQKLLQQAEFYRHENKMQNEYSGDEDDAKSRRFRPVSRQGSGDQRFPSYMNEQGGRTLSVDALHDHQMEQLSKPAVSKRRRTDSRASSLASHDDAGRHSDASNASASSRRKRKSKSRNRAASMQRRDTTSERSKLFQNSDASSRAAQARRRYFAQLRLSETDDSTDSDSDNSHSSNDTSTSFDDAGHLVDDYADPEWDVREARRW